LRENDLNVLGGLAGALGPCSSAQPPPGWSYHSYSSFLNPFPFPILGDTFWGSNAAAGTPRK